MERVGGKFSNTVMAQLDHWPHDLSHTRSHTLLHTLNRLNGRLHYKLNKEVGPRPGIGHRYYLPAYWPYSLFPFILFFNRKFYIERQYYYSRTSLVTCLHTIYDSFSLPGTVLNIPPLTKIKKGYDTIL